MDPDNNMAFYKVKRTNARDDDYRQLVTELDTELAIRDGEEHAFYASFNSSEHIKYTVLVYDGVAPVGCGALKQYSPTVMEIKRMYVRDSNRRRGIASLILKELEYWAAELNFPKCILETGKNQPEALQLYDKRGYKIIDNYGQYAEAENSICFEKAV